MVKKCACGVQMKCYDSRQRTDYVWRRYRCPSCGEYKTTHEFDADHVPPPQSELLEEIKRLREGILRVLVES